jgi:AcrR family transcriptional regulator
MTDATAPAGRRYGGKTAQERRAERRQQLLDAGLALFGTAGYASTTIEQLCAEAHLHPRYFYEQFESREALLQAVYDRHVDAVLAQVSAAIETVAADPRSRLQTGLTVFVEATLADERAARINYFEMVGVSPALEQRRRDVLRAYAQLIASQASALRSQATSKPVELRLAAVALVGATDGLLIDWLSHDPRGDRAAIVTTLIETFATAI